MFAFTELSIYEYHFLGKSVTALIYKGNPYYNGPRPNPRFRAESSLGKLVAWEICSQLMNFSFVAAIFSYVSVVTASFEENHSPDVLY